MPRIARHLGQHEQTVRAWIKAFLAGGFDALPNKPRGGKVSALTSAMLESVRAEVARGTRTWTAAQLADWVAERHGVRLSADRVRIHDLRHTYATIALGTGAPVREVADILGHSSPATTLRIYGHAIPGRGARLVSAVEEYHL